MTTKENQSKAGNKSLLQTARTKNFGAGKFALLSLKSKPQPPLQKVKVDGKLRDDKSRVSDITPSSGERKIIINQPPVTKNLKQKGKQNDIENEVESNVLGMAMISGNSPKFSLSKAHIPATTTKSKIAGSGEYVGEKQNAVQSTTFFSLWPSSTSAINDISNPNVNHHQQHSQSKSKKLAKSSKPGKKEVILTGKKTMDISKGLQFSAPTPMTLNRYEPQMGQEKTAPESKEYLELQAKKKKKQQKEMEAKHMAEAKFTIEERLKQAFGFGETDAGLVDEFNDSKNLVGSTSNRKKKMMKKILGKVRPKDSQKWQQNQDKSSAIQAAMAAAAAAVEAATGNHSGLGEGGNQPISEEEARAIVNQALAVSRQKKKTSSVPGLLNAMFHPSMINSDHHKMSSQEIDELGRPVQFPVNEVMMKHNEDSVSDLDASIRNMRRLPVAEIHMKSSTQFKGDESVSTLGTPRVFEQLDKLLLSEPHRLQQRPGLIHDYLEDNMGGSAAPPPMVTSHDARALIDQLDSGTMVGDMTAGTARAENAVQFCNIASNCFHPEHKSLFMESSSRHHAFEDNTSIPGEEDSFDDDSRSSDQEKTSNDDQWSPPTPAFTQAIDNAIRKAEIQNDKNRPGNDRNKGGQSSSPGHKVRTIPRPSQVEQTANFDSFMNIAASKLDKVDETTRDRYSTEIDHMPTESSKRNKIDSHEKNINGTATKTRGGVRKLNRNAQLGDDARNELLVMEQGRFLLEKDDAYWDTLSTIASTANDRSSESDAYMDEFVQPGPIPGEITTSSSEIKSVNTPAISDERAFETKRHLEQGFLSRSDGNLDEMMNDVADLIDSDLLDNLPITKNRRSNNTKSLLKSEKNFDMIEKRKLIKSNQKMTRMMRNQMRPYPETIDKSKVEEDRNGSLAVTASQIGKGIRSVSWGFEEIYEDKNPHLDFSDQETNNSERSQSRPQKERPRPEDMHRSQRRSLYSADVQPGEEEDLLSRTLELSKGLLETIMGSQLSQENNKKEEGQNVRADDSLDQQYDQSHLNENSIQTECRDDFHHEENTALHKTEENDFSPAINSRLESLRNQRAQALSKFQQSKRMQMSPTIRTEKTESTKRDRDRLTYYSMSRDYGNQSSKERDGNMEYNNYQKAVLKQSDSDDSDIELKYTTSDSNASTTPSQKARDLRMQLDKAMRASREIQISQNELGNELNSFKKKYYKNPEIQNYSKKAVHGF